MPEVDKSFSDVKTNLEVFSKISTSFEKLQLKEGNPIREKILQLIQEGLINKPSISQVGLIIESFAHALGFNQFDITQAKGPSASHFSNRSRETSKITITSPDIPEGEIFSFNINQGTINGLPITQYHLTHNNGSDNFYIYYPPVKSLDELQGEFKEWYKQSQFLLIGVPEDRRNQLSEPD